MKDKFGNDLSVGDWIIVTVSKGSHYLTIAQILDIDEDKVMIQYSSTVKTKWINPGEDPCLRYELRENELHPELGLFRDGTNRPCRVGDGVAYKQGQDIAFGRIVNIESDLWATIEDIKTGEKIRVRNVQVIILTR